MDRVICPAEKVKCYTQMPLHPTCVHSLPTVVWLSGSPALPFSLPHFGLSIKTQFHSH